MHVTKLRFLSVCFFILFAVVMVSAAAHANIAPVAVYADFPTTLKTDSWTTITCGFYDHDGSADLVNCGLLINSKISNSGGAHFFYNKNASAFFMKNNAGVVLPATGRAPGSDFMIETENAILDCKESKVESVYRWTTISFKVKFKSSMGNKSCNVYMTASDDAGASQPWTSRGTLGIQLNVPPTLGTVSPSSGTIPLWKWTTITCKYSDANGDILPNCSLLINDTLTNLGGAHFIYDGQYNCIYMKNNAGALISGQDSSLIESENALLDVTGTKMTRSGNTVTIDWRVMLKKPMASKLCNLYMRVIDINDASVGWTGKGQITAGPANNTPPNIGTVTPNSGVLNSNQPMTIVSTYSDADGAANIRTCSLLINSELSNSGGAHFIYDSSKKTFLMKDDQGALIDGDWQYVDNYFATLDKLNSSATLNGNTITIKWHIALASNMAKNCNIYLSTKDYADASFPWTKKGQISLNTPPMVGMVAPESTLIPTEQWWDFSSTYYDPDVPSNLTLCELLVNKEILNAGGARFIYDRAVNKLYMRNNSGALVGGIAPGAAGVIQSENALLDCAATTIAVNGSKTTITWRVKYKANMNGKRCDLYLQASDACNAKDPWVSKGWIRFNSNPVAQSVTPASGRTTMDQWNRITCTYTDADGVADFNICKLLINNTLVNFGGAYLIYDANRNMISMRNNAGAVVGECAPGSSLMLTSENAIVDCAGTTVSRYDNTLVVSWCVKIKSTMIGKTCKYYLMSADDSGGTQAWAQRGSLEVIAAYNTYNGEMIYIPAGTFVMGNTDVGDAYWDYGEISKCDVYMSGYYIGKYEVTRGQYKQFMNANGYSNPAYWSTEGWKWKKDRTQPDFWAANQQWGYGPPFVQTDNHPVAGVSYYEAEAFCNWAGGHLPTDAQWEKAARWNSKTNHPNIYPWGDLWDREKCNNISDSNAAGGGFDSYQTAPVGSYPGSASAYGCEDMAGNVSEWCRDWSGNWYYGYQPEGGWVDPQGPQYGSDDQCWEDGSDHSVRGGDAFHDEYYEYRCSFRFPDDTTFFWLPGFRLAR